MSVASNSIINHPQQQQQQKLINTSKPLKISPSISTNTNSTTEVNKSVTTQPQHQHHHHTNIHLTKQPTSSHPTATTSLPSSPDTSPLPSTRSLPPLQPSPGSSPNASPRIPPLETHTTHSTHSPAKKPTAVVKKLPATHGAIFELRELMWPRITAQLTAAERTEAERIIGHDIVVANDDLYREASSLLSIWQSLRKETDMALGTLEEVATRYKKYNALRNKDRHEFQQVYLNPQTKEICL